MFQVPETDLKHRNELQNLSREERWTLLREKDIASANKLSINDDYRVIRALEVMKSGVLWSSLQENRSEGFLSEPGVVIKGLFLNRNRQDLYERINKRARFMIENGMIEETKLVMEKFGESCPGLSSLGYNFALDLIKGRMSIDTFYEKLSQSHRNYAKKQITWFNKENILVPVSPNDALEHMKNI